MKAPALSDDGLARADGLFRSALADGSVPEGLTVLGYGEISTAVAFAGVALKRLPPFASGDVDQRVADYRALFDEYLATLASRGVSLVPSELREVRSERGRVVYCVQPVLSPKSLGPVVFRTLERDREALAGHLRTLFETFRRVVDARVGFDGQLSNWAVMDDDGDAAWHDNDDADGDAAWHYNDGADGDAAWHYLDVTTPLLRDEGGRDRLDADLFLAMLPRPLRPIVLRFLLHSITETYFSARSVTVDFLGNLIKERLETALSVGVEMASELFDPAITEREVRANYRFDARMWEWLLRLRRVDRWWHRRILRRTHPFLLPGKIER